MDREKTLSLVEHLTELRKRLIWVIVVFVLSAIAGLCVSGYALHYLKSVPPAASMEWNAFSPWDGIKIYMDIALVISMLVTLPFALYQIWGFAKPGLRVAEQKAALRYIPLSIVLLLIGLCFAYFVVFPAAFGFTLTMTRNIGATEMYGVVQYFHFMFNLIIPVAIAFELPVIAMFLTKLRILNPERLGKIRRYAYLVLVIVASMISPPEFVSHLMVAVPFILLYEISVFASRLVYRKQQQSSDRALEPSMAD